jgi:hypothetical protein
MNYSSTQGLASLGRNGDSMLVHMSPSEVAGLQGLAMAQGGSLTINPNTGLPEAFNLGGFFKSLLPTIAGGLVSMVPGLQPFGLSAMQAGILAGAATGALTNKNNPLMGAALGGLGGYGGVGIGDALSKTMAITSPAAAASSGVGATISGVGPGAVGTTGQIGGANLIGSGVAGGTAASRAAAQNIMTSMNNAGVNIADPIVQDVSKNALQTLPQTSNFSGINMDPTSSFLKATPFDQAYGTSVIQPSGTMGGSTLIGEGRNLANSAASAQSPLIAGAMSNSPTPGFGETFVDQLGGSSAAMKKLGLPLAGAAITGGLEASDFYGKPLQRAEAEKYDPYARLNLGSDTGLRLVAKGGYIDGYATGGTIQSGGIRDLYGTPDNQPTISPGLSGFGLGRLNNLAGEQAMTQAQTLGYAEGGVASLELPDPSKTVSAPENLENMILNETAKTEMLENQLNNMASNTLNTGNIYTQNYAPGALSNVAAGMQNQSVPPQASFVQNLTSARTGYADGGDVVAGEKGMNLDKQRALNLDLIPSLNVETGKQNYTTPESFFHDFYTGNMPQFNLAGPPGQGFSYIMKAKLNDGSTIGQNMYDKMMQSRTKMAKGGYLDGAGDGMSDSIPATIEGKQPARLADGEFVVPADVVSHLGNGSSKAGSKRLYAMLDKVRRARTGNKKQGKQIKPEKYMPA